MSNCIKIFNGITAADKNSFPTCLLKARIVSFGFCSESINRFISYWASVNGKSVIIGNSCVFCATAVFLAVIPTFVIARASTAFRTLKRTAVFLTLTTVFWKSDVFMHCRFGFTDLKDLGLLLEALALTGVASKAVKDESIKDKPSAFNTCDRYQIRG